MILHGCGVNRPGGRYMVCSDTGRAVVNRPDGKYMVCSDTARVGSE